MIAQPTQDTPTSSIQTYENQSPETQNTLPSTSET